MREGGVCDARNKGCIPRCRTGRRSREQDPAHPCRPALLSRGERVFAAQPGVCGGVRRCRPCSYRGSRALWLIRAYRTPSKLRGGEEYVFASILLLSNMNAHVGVRIGRISAYQFGSVRICAYIPIFAYMLTHVFLMYATSLNVPQPCPPCPG